MGTNVRATSDPSTIGTVDLVLIAVKLWDTEPAAQAVKPIVGAHTAVLSLQNGVIKDDLLRREFGNAAVMGGVGYVATHIARPGVILQTGTLQRLIFGEYDGRRKKRAEQLWNVVRAGNFKMSFRTNTRTLWKVVFIVGLWERKPMRRRSTDKRASSTALFERPHERDRRVGRALGVDLPRITRRGSSLPMTFACDEASLLTNRAG